MSKVVKWEYFSLEVSN